VHTPAAATRCRAAGPGLPKIVRNCYPGLARVSIQSMILQPRSAHRAKKYGPAQDFRAGLVGTGCPCLLVDGATTLDFFCHFYFVVILYIIVILYCCNFLNSMHFFIYCMYSSMVRPPHGWYLQCIPKRIYFLYYCNFIPIFITNLCFSLILVDPTPSICTYGWEYPVY
jgi:hypothetical protein